MAFFAEESLLRRAAALPATGPATGFGENVSASFESGRMTGRSRGDLQALYDVWDGYIDEVERDNPNLRLGNPVAFETAPGVASASTVEGAESIAFKRLEAAGIAPRSAEDLRQEARKLAAQRRQESEDIASRATELGGLGALVGSGGAVLTDPPVLGSMLLGAPASAGILRTALTEAAIGGASEIAILPMLAGSRERLEMPLTTDEAIENVLFATVGGAVFGGGIKALGKGLGLVSDRLRPVVDQAVAEAEALPVSSEIQDAAAYVTRAEEMGQATPFDRSLPTAQAEHIARFDEALNAGREGRAADLPSTGRAPVRREMVQRQPLPVIGELQAATRTQRAADLGEQIRRVVAREAAAESDLLRPREALERFQQNNPGATADDELVRLFDMLRNPRKQLKPESLVQFLRARGGLRDDGGELSQGLGLSPKDRPGFINNKSGKNLDEAALAAQEAGFFPGRNLEAGDRVTPRDLLDAIDAEFRGAPLFSEFDEADVQTLRDVADLDRALSEAGASIDNLNAEDIPQVLQRAAEARAPQELNGAARNMAASRIMFEGLENTGPELDDALEARVRGEIEELGEGAVFDLDDGNPLTVRQILDDLDDDQRLVDEFAACIAGGTA